MKNTTTIYLDTYILQKDMRIRLPKAILANLDAKCGETEFGVYYDPINSQIILKKAEGEDGSNE